MHYNEIFTLYLFAFTTLSYLFESMSTNLKSSMNLILQPKFGYTGKKVQSLKSPISTYDVQTVLAMGPPMLEKFQTQVLESGSSLACV